MVGCRVVMCSGGLDLQAGALGRLRAYTQGIPMKLFSHVLVAMVSLTMAASAFAFKLTPIEAEFGLGRLAVQTFKVENPGTQPVAIEISVHSRAMLPSGEDVLAPTPEAFVVFPDQIVLQAGETPSVRVQWTGEQIPETEMAYRLMAEQLPIDIGSEGASRSGLKLLVKYLGALYVRPADPAARLEASIARETRNGQNVAVVAVQNSGNAHAVLQASMLEVRAGEKSLSFNDAQRDAVHGKNVLAGVSRELILPWSSALEDGELTVVLKQASASE